MRDRAIEGYEIACRGARGGYFVVSTREGIAIALLMICVRTCYTHGSS